MAPVQRCDSPITNGFTLNHNKVSTHKHSLHRDVGRFQYSPLKLVHCTLHLDQVLKKNFLKSIPKLKETVHDNADGRIVHPLVFKPFDSTQLRTPSDDGNVTYIMELSALLERYPHVFGNSSGSESQSILLSRGKRDISRYASYKTKVASNIGDTWYNNFEGEEENLILRTPGTKNDLSFNVDVIPSDLCYLRRHWVREVVDHTHCKSRGISCTNLMTRDVAWDACHFQS